MKVAKLKSFRFETRKQFLDTKSGEMLLPYTLVSELSDKLGTRMYDLEDKFQAFVRVGTKWKILRGKLRTESFHCLCGCCSPETRFYIVPPVSSKPEASAT